MNEKLLPVLAEMEKVIFGKRKQCELALCCLLAGGHLLLEDVPGVGKTTLALTLSRTLDLSFGRIQFTPDTLPGDVTGYSTVNMATGQMVFHEGPVMNHIVLADEINRTSPKTQASLLEVMEERQVTVEGSTRKVEEPFMVIATENPIEFSGTYQLPEAQLDRFLMRISLGYPEKDDELNMIARDLAQDSDRKNVAIASQVLTREEVLQLRLEASRVKVSDAIRNYILDIVVGTRQSRSLSLGASPRATLALLRASQAWAFLHGQSYVIPEDVQEVADPVLSHRLVLSLDASLQNATASGVLKECLRTVAVPPMNDKETKKR
ncbi:MAG: MoxR family ATPase [Firmicutes bacterium]|nr:MoxR family ATPase [Bacillota bacterium]